MSNVMKAKLGDVATEIKRQCRDWSSQGVEWCVRGEDFDSGSVYFKRKGGVSEAGPTFFKHFHPGEVLYMTRRAYLSKCSVPDFSGVTANTTLILDANESHIHKGLLVYLMQSSGFTSYAIDKSVGSTNPYTKWSDLKKYEFSLPDMRRQGEIYTVLSAATDLRIKAEKHLENAIKTKQRVSRKFILGDATFHQLFGAEELRPPKGRRLLKLGDVLSNVQYGLSESSGRSGKYPMLRMMNIEDGYVVENDIKYVDLNDREFSKFELKYGDVLFNRTNSMDLVGRTGIYRLNGSHVFASYLLRLVVDRGLVTPEYINHFLNLNVIQYRLKAYATPGVSQANINPTSLKSLPLLVPDDIDEVAEISAKLDSLDDSVAAAKNSLEKVVRMEQSLIDEYFH